MEINKWIAGLLLLAGFTAGAQMESPYEKKRFIQGADTLNYRLLMPEHFDPTEEYPVVLFLHGAGERGSDNEKQLTHGSSLFTSPINRSAFPAIVLAPQCASGDYWAQVEVDRSSYPIGLDFQYEKGPTRSLGLVMELLDSYRGLQYVDNTRIYIMGLSMGGMGTFELLHRLPDVFAAAVPICGAGDPETVAGYADKVPLWIFHGAVDQVVAPDHSLHMVNKLFDAGARPGFTLYDRVNHNSWDYAFAEPELLPWLFSHKK
ncbi:MULTISPECIES: prolyl oligopeptidase family serine peptidase [Robiginitalea]|uniref:carboxylesterase family protein n=1 Tax=Robiginitalea TaxID=252306 RepID=UPI0023496B88|nr:MULTISPECIES: prolyl oligopeptidase family serine peptidase [unclassified Robiginitalea]MDC6353100.1 prolyl oligopeptidase family serine peptidase [Robiginitalea sp. PM2]MDC6373733.1 prolyl oligopeptidase family serine peptidase [Robiginitalea sp. SP8]